MSDLVVTVPKGIWLEWLSEGDAVGEPETGEEWGFFLGGGRPPIAPGERLYIVAWGRLRGYAPVTRLAPTDRGWAICRRGGAVAVTIGQPIPGFRGFRKRWWERAAELPFPEWMTAGVRLENAGQTTMFRR
jgi:hypothetical protein